MNDDFSRSLEKKLRRNPLGEDVRLLPDGSVVRDEDKIVAIQRIWRERAYAPPQTLFASRGKMYKKYRSMMIDGGLRRRPVEEARQNVRDPVHSERKDNNNPNNV
jgi:hypothetical protein